MISEVCSTDDVHRVTRPGSGLQHWCNKPGHHNWLEDDAWPITTPTWAPPKCKFFSWLAIQNRLWTADRLHSRGWPHNPVCSLCRRARETGNHLFFECRFTRHIWTDLASWIAAPPLLPDWKAAESLHTCTCTFVNAQVRCPHTLKMLSVVRRRPTQLQGHMRSNFFI